MKTNELELKLQEIDKDITITPSQRQGLDSVNYKGVSMFAIPSEEIAETPEDSKFIEIMDKMIRHRSVPEALAMAKAELEKINTDPDHHDAFFGIGEYK